MTDLSKTTIGALSVILGFIAFVPYFIALYKRTIKPHCFTWFIWSLVYLIVYCVQTNEGAGSGAWFSGMESILCLSIALVAVVRGNLKINFFDYVCLTVALIAVLGWILLRDPLAVVLITVLIEILAFIPTFRKSYIEPFQENLSSFVIATAAVVLSICALEAYSPATYVYPVTIVLTNTLFVVMLLVRRQAT